jgi:hypothetical protein
MAGKRRRARESGNPPAKTRSDKDERTTLADMTAEAERPAAPAGPELAST